MIHFSNNQKHVKSVEMKNKVLILTTLYPAPDIPKTDTPVVHYFAREWVKMGYEVRVVHYVPNFPKWLYKITKPFKDVISAYVGFGIRTNPYLDREYEIEDVNVKRITLKKMLPHTLYPRDEVNKALSKTLSYCNKEGFVPDIIISHWANPTLDIMCQLKDVFNVPICYVAHGANEVNVYKERAKEILSKLDVIGFRSDAIKRRFLSLHHLDTPSFQCNSGIPEEYICSDVYKHWDNVNKFIYCGTLIKRKYPDLIIRALKLAYGEDAFEMTYIGNGGELKKIMREAHKCHVRDCVKLLGRIPREEVVRRLDDAQVFIMISRNEAFGLVYLEAMARGCLTIASRDEGFDGIIEDNVNGFLCKAGDYTELAQIITKIRNMTLKERQRISNNAIETARRLTDKNVAKLYIDSVLC